MSRVTHPSPELQDLVVIFGLPLLPEPMMWLLRLITRSKDSDLHLGQAISTCSPAFKKSFSKMLPQSKQRNSKIGIVLPPQVAFKKYK
jgi:hypothetical protein